MEDAGGIPHQLFTCRRIVGERSGVKFVIKTFRQFWVKVGDKNRCAKRRLLKKLNGSCIQLSDRASRLVSIPHTRCPWRGNEVVHVFTRWGRLKGTDESARFKAEFQAYYERAKRRGDYEAADRLVSAFWEGADDLIDRIVDDVSPFLQKGIPVVCVLPHPSFDDEDGSYADPTEPKIPLNAIPFQFAARIAIELDAEVDSAIIERERVGRTTLTKIERFLWQPSFTGTVRCDVAYVLVDDVLTLGGTLAALRSYILSAGGTVASIAALAHHTGKTQDLALSGETWNDLTALFGADIDRFWKEEVGHDANCLTEAEGKFLVSRVWEGSNKRRSSSLLQRLRDCLFEASASGRKSNRA